MRNIYQFFLPALAVLPSFSACTPVMHRHHTDNFASANVFIKDFEPIQMVFAKVTLESKDGETPAILYHDLIIQAHKLGAHAIINVNTEDVKSCTGENNCTITRFASALAIKYIGPNDSTECKIPKTNFPKMPRSNPNER